MTSSTVRRWLPVVIALLAGASVGFGVVRVQERVRVESGPSGWPLVLPNIPVLLARLTGPPLSPDEGWPLASHGALQTPGGRVQALEVEATLPETGHLEVVLEGSGAQKGVALQVDRGRNPFALVTTAEKVKIDAAHPLTDWEALTCDRSLPTPTEARVRVRLESDAGVIRAGVAVGDQEMVTARCAWRKPLLGASVRSGLRRIGIQSLSVVQMNRAPLTVTAPRASGWSWLVAMGLGALTMGLVAALLRRWPQSGVRGGAIVAVSLPLVFVGPLSGADLVAGLQAVRLVFERPLWTALVLPAMLSLVFAAGLAMARIVRSERSLARPWRVALGGLLGLAALPGYGAVGAVGVVPGAGLGELWGVLARRWGSGGPGPLPVLVLGAMLTGGMAWGLAPRHGMAITYASVVGMALGSMVWLNVRRPSGYNLLSLLAVAMMAFMADQGLRWTDTGARLTGRSARARNSGDASPKEILSGTFSSFEALEHTREWSKYPLQDYPVEPTPRRPDAVRLVALGGSSTGGAWQNDNLDQFWPAELERRHGPSVQAVNQGVGGWTTLHIRRFLETRIDDVDPDVVVLYVGHNDILTESVRPYGDLYAAWQRGSDVSVSVSGALSNVPLYQLARFGLQSTLGGSIKEAVPVADAQANLDRLVELLEPRNVPLLVAREGVSPDPSVLDPYGEMLSGWAARTPNAAYVDTAAQLSGPGAGKVFLDNCHLTERGHSRVAEAVRAALLEQGWIPASDGG